MPRAYHCFKFYRHRSILTAFAVLCVSSWLFFVHRIHFKKFGASSRFSEKDDHDFKFDLEDFWFLSFLRRKKNNEVNNGVRIPPKAALSSLSTNGCPLPELLIDDPFLQKYFSKPKPLECRSEKNWVYVENQTFFIDPDIIKQFGLIDCTYTKFWRQSDHITLTETFPHFQSGRPVESDFFKVICKASEKKAYRNVHATVVPSKTAIRRANAIRQPKNSPGLNVYIFGLDSVSRMTFMRTLPKTYAYLTEKLGTIVLKGYNIVGDGTPQAFIPILTGKTEVELPMTRKRVPDSNYVDVYPMVWKDFQKAGYVTLYGEDSAKVGTFTYRLKGFKQQPTDHYLRTFYTIAEQEYKFHPRWCFGSAPQHRAFIRYAEDFFTAYPTVKKFGLMHHSILTHDNINTVRLLDDDLLKHFQYLEVGGHLNNTLMIVMADHGHRFAHLRETQQGQLEERLPFFSFTAPDWFRRNYKMAWENLIANTERLTTPFDVHATLKALIDWHQPKIADLNSRSLSLWDKIPVERNCEQAGVEAHWCVCLNWQSVQTNTSISIILAKALVGAINREILPEIQLCSPLKLQSIESVKRLVPANSVLQYKGAKDKDGFVPDLSAKVNVTFALYQVRFRTRPGDAHYEATLRYDNRMKNALEVNLDSISHINRFGDNPHCIIDKNYFLAKWCICYDKIENGK